MRTAKMTKHGWPTTRRASLSCRASKLSASNSCTSLGNDIERGIHDYEAGTIDGRGLNKYGLVQSRFGLLHGGVVERMAQQVTPAIRRDAVHHFRAFRASLSIRIKEPKKAKSKLDAGNQQMLATSGFYRIGRRLTAYESVDACPHRLASSPS